jgi:hypothetical protein
VARLYDLDAGICGSILTAGIPIFDDHQAARQAIAEGSGDGARHGRACFSGSYQVNALKTIQVIGLSVNLKAVALTAKVV